MATKKPTRVIKTARETRVETEHGTLIIRRNRKGELLWRIESDGNWKKISGSTEGHDEMRTIRRSLDITRRTLIAASGLV